VIERMSRPGGDGPRRCRESRSDFYPSGRFDRHRAGSHTHDDRRCLDPAAVGLVDAGRAYPCWGFPGRGEYEGDL
jgi:hypothetical protein